MAKKNNTLNAFFGFLFGIAATFVAWLGYVLVIEDILGSEVYMQDTLTFIVFTVLGIIALFTLLMNKVTFLNIAAIVSGLIMIIIGVVHIWDVNRLVGFITSVSALSIAGYIGYVKLNK